MPARGSFQKHQKEIARKEKRQQKLDRRQGRVSAGTPRPEAPSLSDDTPVHDQDQDQDQPQPSPLTADHPVGSAS